MGKVFSNGARAKLASSINSSDTELVIESGGALFPIADTGTAPVGNTAQWFKLVLQDQTGYEVVYCRTHALGSNTFSDLLRGQEGTVARGFESGSVVGNRPTAQDARDWEGKLDVVPGKQLSTEDYTTVEKQKLGGIAKQATKNASDAQLRDRSTHTGTQGIDTIEGLQTELGKGLKKANNLSDLTNAATARTNLGLGNSATHNVGTSSNTVAAGNDSRITGAAQKSANLSDLTNAATARSNLGAAAENHTHSQYWNITSPTGYAPSKDLNEYVAGEGGHTKGSDANSPGSGYRLVTLQGYGSEDRTQLALPQRNVQNIKYRSRNTDGTWTPWSTVWSTHNFSPSTKLDAAANLSDLLNKAAARTNLGLGTAATRNVGTTSGTVAAGDDDRIRHAVQSATPGATIIVSTSAPSGGNDGDIWLRYE